MTPGGTPSGSPPATPINAMTVDVEDYFHVSGFESVIDRRRWSTFESRVERNTERLLAIFEQADVRATFFVLGWVACRMSALVRRIAAAGHEVASHGDGHELIYRLSRAEFREDLSRARDTLQSVLGVRVVGYRAPSFSITSQSLWALDILIEEGYAYDSSIVPVHHDRYGVRAAPRHAYRVERPGGSLVEIPVSTVPVGPLNVCISGGGYFRLLPYAWTRWGIARLNSAEQQPAVFYLHPWEVDPDQPRVAASPVNRFRHYVGLKRTEARLVQLLKDFRFATVATTFSSLLEPQLPRSLQSAMTSVHAAALARMA